MALKKDTLEIAPSKEGHIVFADTHSKTPWEKPHAGYAYEASKLKPAPRTRAQPPKSNGPPPPTP